MIYVHRGWWSSDQEMPVDLSPSEMVVLWPGDAGGPKSEWAPSVMLGKPGGDGAVPI